MHAKIRLLFRPSPPCTCYFSIITAIAASIAVDAAAHCSLLPALQERGFDPVYGARPVKRAVQRELETALAKGMLRGEFGEEDTVIVEAPGGAKATALVISRKGGEGRAKPSVDDSLDLDVGSYQVLDSIDGASGNGADEAAVAGSRL